MQSEHFRRWVEGKPFDVADELTVFNNRRWIVQSAFGVLVILLEGSISDVALEDCCDESHVLVVGDSATVVDFSTEVVQNLEGDGVVLVQEHLQLALADR